MNHYVLVQSPGKRPFYVRCADLDQCLEVVGSETSKRPVGTRVAITRTRSGHEISDVLGVWHVWHHGVRRYNINSHKNMEDLIKSARNAYVYGEMNREEVIDYLIREHGASKQDAVLASAAGKVLCREYNENISDEVVRRRSRL